MSNKKNTDSLPKSFPMNGGNGTYSYSKNSSIQREASTIVKSLINCIIAEKLDVEIFSSTSNTFRIADLGCSVGPNTFITIQNVIEAVEHKYQSKSLESRTPEFQVFFNDHATNDFNTLFTTLPLEKQYFAAGVPGSFHGRLFPQASLHIVCSSYALQWLSKVPEEVQNKDSPAWNKGKSFYTNASDEVANAYAAQFGEDMDNFLNIRAREVVGGGMMLLIIPSAADEIHHSQMCGGWFYEALGSTLMDMAKEGLTSEDLVDSFNVPVYIPYPKDITRLVGRNNYFSIESMKLTDPVSNVEEPVNIHSCLLHLRAAVEGLITKHFGSEIMGELFDRFYHKVAHFEFMDPNCKRRTLLFVALKRK